MDTRPLGVDLDSELAINLELLPRAVLRQVEEADLDRLGVGYEDLVVAVRQIFVCTGFIPSNSLQLGSLT